MLYPGVRRLLHAVVIKHLQVHPFEVDLYALL